MSQDWPSAQSPQHFPLPRIDELPIVWEGYDRAYVEEAFNAFYRHIAQLDATLHALESVETFRREAADLRAHLHAIRTAGWSPYPRGYAVPPPGGFGLDLPEAVPRIALETAFLIAVAVAVAVAKFSALEIILVMLGAVAITFVVELVASRDRRTTVPPAPQPPAVQPLVEPEPAQEPEPVGDEAGWAAFAESGAAEALTVMGSLAPEAEPAAEVEPEPVEATAQTARESARRFARKQRAQPNDTDETADASPRHVRVLATAERAEEDELDPWERGFDDFD